MLFLSFAGEDEEAVRALAAGFKSVGVEVWCSAVDGMIPDGRPYRDAMYEALARCAAFAVLIGDGPFDGAVKEETDWAIDRYNHDERFRVVPLRFDRKRVLPEPLKRFQSLQLVRDLAGQDLRYFSNLARRMGVAAGPVQPGDEPPKPRKSSKPFAIAASLAAIALVLFIGSRTRWFGLVHAKGGNPPPPGVGPGPHPRDPGRDPHGTGPSTDRPGPRSDSPGPTQPDARGTNTSSSSNTPPDDPAVTLAKLWSASAERISADSRFRSWGQRLAPQVGLIPIGPDPRTRLEEFAADDGGEVPQRDAAGVYQLGERSSLVMVLLPPGSFSMGSKIEEEESPIHEVRFDAPFFLARTEVPAGVYERVTGKQLPQTGSRLLPATYIDWNEADQFVRELRLRLPSEAEWEYGCRAGTNTPFWSGDQAGTLTTAGWFASNSGEKAHAVAEIGTSNAFGLFDTHGNVWEWCEDTWHPSYARAPADGSAWVDSKSKERVVRGGSADKEAKAARSAYRNHRPIDTRGLLLGFRPARSVSGG